MKVTTPEISWHGRDPIYSVDFQPGNHHIQRLASGGVDKIVRIWQITYDDCLKGNVDFLSNLRRHTASINAVRFSKTGELLASAGDDHAILIWQLSDVPAPSSNIFAEDDVEEDKETWVCYKTLRGHLGDVQDLSWSKDGRFLISGSVDNSAIVWDVKKAQKIAFFNDHKSYVQGVTFDPLGDYVATLSSDRSMRIFSLNSKNCVNNVSKMTPIVSEEQQNTQPDAPKPKASRIFHDDGLRSFFRRLEFSADGHLLFAPAGCMEVGDKVVNCSFVFVRGAFSRPALYLPSGEKATIVIRANPQLFELRPPKDFDPSVESQSEDTPKWETHKSLFSLPYRIVFAVATDDSVLIYDSQQTMPVALLKNIHYHQISDLSWSPDGNSLIISSTDGFCTIGTFEDGELGIPYSDGSSRRSKKSAVKPSSPVQTSSSSDAKESQESLPFSRYAAEDKNDTAKVQVPEPNTKLNIRRVETKSKSTDSTPAANNTDKGKSSEGSSPKLNTSLNIRKVKKSGSSPVSEGKKKEVCDDDVEMKLDSEKAMDNSKCNTSPKINTTLNVRKVKKEKKVSNKDEEVSDKKKVDEELSSGVKKMDVIEDVVMLDSEKCDIEKDSVKEDSSSSNSSETKEKKDGKKRIQLTTLSSLKE